MSLVGIEGLTLNIFNCSLMVNWASGGNRLDWATATIYDDAHDKYGRLADYDKLTNEVELQIGGWMDLGLFGVVMAYGGFRLYKGQMGVNDGSYDAAEQTGIEPFKADLLSISFEQVSLFAGAGGEFPRAEDSNPNDNIDPPVTGFNRNNGAVGFYVSNANLTSSILKEQEATNAARTYLGLEFSLGGVGLAGIEGLTSNIFNCSLMVNWSSEGDRLDWTTATINDDTHGTAPAADSRAFPGARAQLFEQPAVDRDQVGDEREDHELHTG